MMPLSFFFAHVLCICISWMLHFLKNGRRAVVDLLVVVCIAGVRHQRPIREAVATSSHASRFQTALGLIGLTTTFFMIRSARRKKGSFKEDQIAPDRAGLKPMLFPCRTTHTRLFPTFHNFAYSYLYAGVPIGWTGSAGTLLSVDNVICSEKTLATSPTSTWFTVEAEDYLQRGRHPNGLEGKLKAYLESQGVPESRYPYAYLVTAPRFCGFSFNPVSFWYLYSAEKELRAMILEVNNTFDERRMYFLETQGANHSHGDAAGPFKFEWPKDFHVSPFNSRDGSYSVTANDPFSPNLNGAGHVDCNVVLLSYDGKPKLVARVHAAGHPLVASAVNQLSALHFVLKWWWVGFMTNPRILREARKLWVKGLEVFYRPEVLLGSIGRTDTREERIIEKYFLEFLRSRANEAKQSITYISAAGPKYGLVQHISADRGFRANDLRMEILTPAFYSELVRLGSMERAVQLFGSSGAGSTRMLYTSDDQLCKTLARPAHNVKRQQASRIGFPILGFTRSLGHWSSISNFSRHAELYPYLSELDHFVLERQSSSWEYIKASLSILICDEIAFGHPLLWRAYGVTIWLVACLLASRTCDMFKESMSPHSLHNWWSVFGHFGVHGISLLHSA